MQDLRRVSLDELGRSVRSALAHLYDSAFLQTHPLARAIDAQPHWDALTPSQHLRRTLLDSIESLRPSPGRATPPEAARAYAILTYRYVDSLSMEDISAKLALSRRQVYREHEKGLQAIARLLADRHGLGATPADSGAELPLSDLSGGLVAMQTEVSRLRSAARTDTLVIKDVLDGVIAMLAPMADDSGVRLKVRHTDEHLCAIGDRVMLRQALIGLLTHAIEHAPDMVQVAVSARGSAAEVAIKTEVRRRVHQSGEDESTELQLIGALIEAQNGASVMTRSATQWQATITLPTCAPSATLLVIDEQSTDLVALFRRYLAGHQITVVGASDGRGVLQLATELKPTLITVDVMMPGLDGWELLQQLKASATTRAIPVVVCSVLKEARLAQSMGAAGYLTKPVSQREFLEMVRRWLGPLFAQRSEAIQRARALQCRAQHLQQLRGGVTTAPVEADRAQHRHVFVFLPARRYDHHRHPAQRDIPHGR